MHIVTQYSIGDVVYVKDCLRPSVYRGTVQSIELKVWAKGSAKDGVPDKFMPNYLLVVSDRRDGGFVHRSAPESICFDSWEQAWFEERTPLTAKENPCPNGT